MYRTRRVLSSENSIFSNMTLEFVGFERRDGGLKSHGRLADARK